MSITVCILILVVMWIVLILYKLDDLDRFAIQAFITSEYEGVPSQLKDKLGFLAKFCIIPLKPPGFFAEFNEGTVYTSYVNKYYPNLARKMDDKLFWVETFRKNGIKHPRLYITNVRGNRKQHLMLDKEDRYIQKPLIGMQGDGVKIVSAAEALQNPPCTMIQELLNSCDKLYTRHFRYVTLFDGTQYYLLELSSQGVVSNHAKGGKLMICRNLTCSHLGGDQRAELATIMKQLAKLHRSEFRQVFSIGWDIMLNCGTNEEPQAFVLEGNKIHGTWGYPDHVEREVVQDYKHRVRHFLGEMGLM